MVNPTLLRKIESLNEELDEDFDLEEEDEFFLDIDLLEKEESKIINSDEIAMGYNKQEDCIISPLHKSISNLMGIFNFKLMEILNFEDRTLEIYIDDLKNKAIINYKIKPVKIDILYEDGKIFSMLMSAFYINPEIGLIYSKLNSGPSKVNLRKIVESYIDNKFGEIIIKSISHYIESFKNCNYIV